MLMHSQHRTIDGAFMGMMDFNFVHKDHLLSTLKIQIPRLHPTSFVISRSEEGPRPYFEILWFHLYCILMVLYEQI